MVGANRLLNDPNSVYLGIGGAAGHYSINYERLIAKYGNTHFYGSIGFSPSLLHEKTFSPRVPIQLKLSFPATKGTEIEIGGGITSSWYTSEYSGYNAWSGSYSYKSREFETFWSGRVGIRHQLGNSVRFPYQPTAE